MTTQQTSKGWNILLWILQLVLASMLLMGGIMKSTKSIEELAAMFPWAGQMSPAFVRFTALVDLLGGLGVLLSSLLRIKPALTVWAAIGALALMLSAIIFHVSRGEASVIGFNVFLAVLAIVIAWGRSKKSVISPR